jgi:tetratricopeptide (TPR) repeat protein
MVAIEDWADLELAAGRERDLLAELAGLVERFPLRERLRGQLMVALFRSGRQADALAEYRRAQVVLREELGLDPGRELQEVHRRILAGDQSGAAGRVRCLPRTVGDFTGRSETVGRLLGVIGEADPAIVVIDGMAGSGKTTLALHVAALVGDRYPDAHLFVDLHGHSEREPLDPAAALLILLRQLRIGAEQVPPSLDERVAQWRTELARRRVLVVLDNAASSEQVAELLPAAPGALALVTSRRRLAGLDGVHSESLPVLTEAEAVTLLTRIAGERVSAQPVAAVEVVRRCGGLPLALRLAGARLAHRPRWQVSDLVRRIGSAALPELAVENRTVVDAFGLSFGQLAAAAQRVFRLLGTYPGQTFDALAVAALGDVSLAEAEDLLDDLVDVHLVDEPEPGLFRLHDLLREYAKALAAELTEQERRAAVLRSLDLEMHAAVAAAPTRLPATLRDLGNPAALRPDLMAALSEPESRLERTRPSLGAFLDAAGTTRIEYVWMLARAAWRCLWTRGYVDDIAALFTTAREAARRAGDLVAQAMAANYLASTHYLRGRPDQAKQLLAECIRLRGEVGDTSGMALAMGNLAALHNANGEYAQAAALAARALAVRQRGTDVDESLRLDVLSFAYSYLGRHAEAIQLQRRRLLLVIDMRDELDRAHTLMHLIKVRFRAGDISPGLAEHRLRVLQREMLRHQYRYGESDVRIELGDVLRAQGRYDEAIAEITLGLERIREFADARNESVAVNLLAQTVREAGDPAAAVPVYRRALELTATTVHRYERARAHLGIGDCLAGKDGVAAGEHWREAYRIFTELQVPERAEAEQRLERMSAAVGP